MIIEKFSKKWIDEMAMLKYGWEVCRLYFRKKSS